EKVEEDFFMNENIAYPEMYEKLYPKVEDTIMKYYPYDDMDEMPTNEELERMIDEIYNYMINDKRLSRN
ncbi:MAG: hypothetical protein ACTHWU_10880, partial [Senegalia sp. (in: firmicutes)]|uniref:hypothetical protein n=1 Tax=Senegalia sp. (in: firmicutes) TaxID=1924098 RepID=UPI003F9A2217